MKILIVGAGAIGLLLTGIISHNGGEVVLFSRRSEVAKYISKNGIKIISEKNEYVSRAECVSSIEPDAKYDLAIVTVKSYDTANIAKLLSEKLSRQTYVLTLQNGLNNAETLANFLGHERVFPGITMQSSTLLGTNEVLHVFNGLTIIGNYAGPPTEDVRKIAHSLSMYGVPCNISENIWRNIWFKLMVNSVINPLTAILRVKNGLLLEIPFIDTLIKNILEEAISIARLHGHEFELDDCFDKIIRIIRETGNNKSSMLQDIEGGRKTEIDYLNGKIVQLAAKHGLEMPINRALTILVKGIEKMNNDSKINKWRNSIQL